MEQSCLHLTKNEKKTKYSNFSNFISNYRSERAHKSGHATFEMQLYAFMHPKNITGNPLPFIVNIVKQVPYGYLFK